MEYIAERSKDRISVGRLVWVVKLGQEERDDTIERVVANGSFKYMLAKTSWIHARNYLRIVARHALTILIAC